MRRSISASRACRKARRTNSERLRARLGAMRSSSCAVPSSTSTMIWRVIPLVYTHSMIFTNATVPTVVGARRSGIGVPRHDLDRGGARAGADHRLEVRAAAVLLPVGVVDEVVDRPVDGLKGDFLRHAGGDDSPRLLPRRGLVPTRVPPVVAAHVEGTVDRDRPDPRWSAVRRPVLTER